MVSLRGTLSWASGALLLAVAGLVAIVTPSDAETESPFYSALVPGEQVTTRTISATWQDIHVGESVSGIGGTSTGLWVVIDLDVAAPREEAHLRYVRLTTTDGIEFRASERAESLVDQRLSPGLVFRGSVVFELPAELRDDHVRVDIGTMLDDTRADGLLSIELDLSEYPLDPEVSLLESAMQ